MTRSRRLYSLAALTLAGATLAALTMGGAALAVPTVGSAALAAPRPQQERLEAAFASRVSESILRRTVRELVGLGPRMGGTPSGDRAAAYVADTFTRLGLQPTVFEDDPKLAHWEDAWTVRLETSGLEIRSAYPYGFSPSVSTTAPLLVSRAANAGPDWAGHVVYTPSSVARAYASLAARPDRPRAILTSAPHEPGAYEDWSLIGELPPRSDNPIPVFGVSLHDGERLARVAGERVRVTLKASTRSAAPRTVVASIAGITRAKYYLIVAHGDSDSGGPGADDNASGVATVLELARIFAMLGDTERLVPRVSLRFAILGSEGHSTRSYIGREGAHLRDCEAVINFDETGTGATREAIYFESNEVPWNERLLRTLDQVGADYLSRPGFWPEYSTNPSQGGTDSSVFLPRAYKGTGVTSLKIPATTIYTAAWSEPALLPQTRGWESRGMTEPATVKVDFSRYYHSSGDLPENTTDAEPQNMVRAVKAAGIALVRLAY